MSTLGIIVLVIISGLLGFFLNSVFFYAKQNVKVGDAAPGFYAELLDGSLIGNSIWKRAPNPILLCFVSPKCAVCRGMALYLKELSEKYPQSSLDVILLGVSGDTKLFEKWKNELNIPFPVGVDINGTSKIRYTVYSLPILFLISSDGIIQYIQRGFRESDEPKLNKLFKENSSK